jgi:mRNA interferase MazF
VLIVSADPFNQGRSRLVVVVPFTSRRRGLPVHVEVRPPDGGLREVSFAMCEQVRSLAVDRLGPQPFGRVPAVVLSAVGDRLRLLLDL